MSIFDNSNNRPTHQNDKRNEIHNNDLKEYLGNSALSLLKQGVDYKNRFGLTVTFGYLFNIGGRGVEALFKVITDMGTCYFAVQKGSLMRISISEDIFAVTVEHFISLYDRTEPACDKPGARHRQ